MYVCMCGCNPPLRRRRAAGAAKGGAPCGSGPRGGGGPLWERERVGGCGGRVGGGRPGGPDTPDLGCQAWAAPSPDLAGSRALVETTPVSSPCGYQLGAVLGTPPAYSCKPAPVTAPSGPHRVGVRVDGSQTLKDNVLIVWRATFAKRQERRRTRSRQPLLPGLPPWTVPPPGGWREPFQARSCSLPVMPPWRSGWVAAA